MEQQGREAVGTYEYTIPLYDIHPVFPDMWEKELDSGSNYLKLCGSGGESYLLGISRGDNAGIRQMAVNEGIITFLTMTEKGFR
jgi:hypothetical protein